VHEKRIEIRWRDMDAFGHVNNAVYLTYLEELRDEWMERTIGSAGDVWDFVLAHVSVDYRRPLTQGDGIVVARVWPAGAGRSSVRTREELRTGAGELCAQAESVMVARDRTTGASRPLTDAERLAVEREMAAGDR
jgi:acyl-CoA thioester hydrolase